MELSVISSNRDYFTFLKMRKKTKLKIINSLEVSSPCHNDNFASNSTETKSGWYCGECKKVVHDLSRYTQKDILKLIDETEGNFCALIKRKADGSVLTKEPPSYSRALLATGVILASTALFSEKASAQVAGVENKNQEASDQNHFEETTVGLIAITPSATPTPEPSPALIEENDTIKTPAAETYEDLSIQNINPLVPTHTRGKVLLSPKTKDSKKKD